MQELNDFAEFLHEYYIAWLEYEGHRIYLNTKTGETETLEEVVLAFYKQSK